MGSTYQLQTQQNPADPEVSQDHDESSKHKNPILKTKIDSSPRIFTSDPEDELATTTSTFWGALVLFILAV